MRGSRGRGTRGSRGRGMGRGTRGSRGRHRGSRGSRGRSRGRGTARGRRPARARRGSRGRGFRGRGATSNVPIILKADQIENAQRMNNDPEPKLVKKEPNAKERYLEDVHSWVLSGLHCDVDDLYSIAGEILAIQLDDGKIEKIVVDEEMEKEMGELSIRVRGYVFSKVVYDSLPDEGFKTFVKLLHFLDLKPSERRVQTFLLSLIPCLATKVLKQTGNLV